MISPEATAVGRCELVCHLASGGMGELYLAKKRGLEGFEKLVVLKTMRAARREDDLRNLVSEARLGATLDHPNIVQIHDVGVQDGRFFIIMEFVHGVDLRRMLARATERRRPIRLDEAISIVLGVCGGLHHAHDKRDRSGKPLGLVHRDVTPSNVLVGFDGSVKLADFGIAQARDAREEDGRIVGKIGYMSPEQCLSERLDRRSDVFAVGILLYELTTGENAYRGDDALATLQSIVHGPAPSPSAHVPDYPPELERIVLRALARDRDDRHGNAQELQLELEELARDQKLAVSPVTLMDLTRELFADELDAWNRAQAKGMDLADHVAATVTVDVRPPEATASARPRRRRRAASAAAGLGVALLAALALTFGLGPSFAAPDAGRSIDAKTGIAAALSNPMSAAATSLAAGAAAAPAVATASAAVSPPVRGPAGATRRPKKSLPRSSVSARPAPARWDPDAPLPP
jgi:tRNA A-37 threonylcarbamoyl transferase component Bud32